MHSIISLSLNINKGIDPWLVNQKCKMMYLYSLEIFEENKLIYLMIIIMVNKYVHELNFILIDKI